MKQIDKEYKNNKESINDNNSRVSMLTKYKNSLDVMLFNKDLCEILMSFLRFECQ